jgi:hypothetical protein
MAGPTLYGASLFRSQNNQQLIQYDLIGKNSVAFTIGDPVYNSSGLLDVAGTTTGVVGIAVKTQTMASNNQTVAKVTPGYIPIRENDLYLMGSTADFTGNATDGKYTAVIKFGYMLETPARAFVLAC